MFFLNQNYSVYVCCVGNHCHISDCWPRVVYGIVPYIVQMRSKDKGMDVLYRTGAITLNQEYKSD